MAEPPAYHALVLAGGRARRLAGADKPGLLVGDRSMLDRVIGAVADADLVVVVGPPRKTARPVRWVREDPPGGGPVAALGAGLAQVTAPYVALLAADLPFLDRTTVRLLRENVAGHDGAVAVDDAGRDQLLLGVWRTPAVRAALDGLGAVDGVALSRLLGPLDVARVRLPAPAGGPAPWWDCDTDDDLRLAREHG